MATILHGEGRSRHPAGDRIRGARCDRAAEPILVYSVEEAAAVRVRVPCQNISLSPLFWVSCLLSLRLSLQSPWWRCTYTHARTRSPKKVSRRPASGSLPARLIFTALRRPQTRKLPQHFSCGLKTIAPLRAS